MSQLEGKLSVVPEPAEEEMQIDPVKHRQSWLKLLADELDKIEPLMPIKYLPDGIEYPQWVQNVERECSIVMLPSARLKEHDYKITPKRLGALLGHMCGMAVWMMEWLAFVNENHDKMPAMEKVVVEEQTKEGVKTLGSLVVWYDAMRDLAKLALSSCVDQSYEDMTDFLLNYAEGFSRKPKTLHIGNLGNPTFEIYVFMLMYWRAIENMDSMRQFHEVLVRVLGANRTGDQKRIEKICQRIGLSFRKPGRPPKKIIQTKT